MRILFSEATMANITKRANGTYLVRVSCGMDANGKPIQKSKTFKPSSLSLSESKRQRELERFVFEFENEVKLNGDIIRACPREYSFAEFCREYKRIKLSILSPDTYKFYEKVLDSFFVPRLGKLKLTEITPNHVQHMIRELMKPGAREDGKGKYLSPATVRRYITVLQSVMTLACKQGFVRNNPADSRRLEFPKVISPDVEVFDDEETESILDALKTEPIHIQAVISTALYTGARRGEIVGLKWSDIDLEEGVLTIKRSVYKPHGEPAKEKPPKTAGSIRTISIPRVLCDVLTAHKAEQDRHRLYLGNGWFDGDYVFTEDDGHVMNPQTPTKQFDHFLKRHGIRHLKFHGLRHTSATLLLSHGCDIKTVSSRLGHTSIDTTNIYVHALAKADKRAAECFDLMRTSS